jgi:hypothetical protein
MRSKSKRRNKSRRHNKTKTNKNKSKGKRRVQKGGLFNISLGLDGENLLSQTHGKKYYDTSQTPPRWRNQTCRKIFGFEYCTLDKDS